METTTSKASEIVSSARSLALIATGMVLAAIWPAALASALSTSWNIGEWGLPANVFLFIAVSVVSGTAAVGSMARLRRSPLWTLSLGFVLGFMAWPLAVLVGTWMLDQSAWPSNPVGFHVVALPIGIGITAAMYAHRRRISTRETVSTGLTGFAVGAVALVPLGSVLLASVDEVNWGDVVRNVAFLLALGLILVLVLAGSTSVMWWKLKHSGTRVPTAPVALLGVSAAVIILVAILLSTQTGSGWCGGATTPDGHPDCGSPLE